MKILKNPGLWIGSMLLSFSAVTIVEAANAQSESDAARIFMLEKALAPKTPGDVASKFAQANKDRNGAVQFMLFSDQLKKQYKENWPSWVSGTSSPWITSYTIKKMTQSKNSAKFVIIYQWATSSGPFEPPLTQAIVVEPVPTTVNSSQQWWITQLSER
ncbi:hypothetical protein [Legionella cardiaca]|uniref:Protein IcmL-like protein n=1 Tax=Legionella cardiaca TaxID=1071983 RepID=A0ABY8AQI1_9GAMM|nr:hypothetical protein [Legionella cardiaca]WED42778.1 hypothetical protein PXX05_12870 [Legionella cardiaca]